MEVSVRGRKTFSLPNYYSRAMGVVISTEKELFSYWMKRLWVDFSLILCLCLCRRLELLLQLSWKVNYQEIIGIKHFRWQGCVRVEVAEWTTTFLKRQFSQNIRTDERVLAHFSINSTNRVSRPRYDHLEQQTFTSPSWRKLSTLLFLLLNRILQCLHILFHFSSRMFLPSASVIFKVTAILEKLQKVQTKINSLSKLFRKKLQPF